MEKIENDKKDVCASYGDFRQELSRKSSNALDSIFKRYNNGYLSARQAYHMVSVIFELSAGMVYEDTMENMQDLICMFGDVAAMERRGFPLCFKHKTEEKLVVLDLDEKDQKNLVFIKVNDGLIKHKVFKFEYRMDALARIEKVSQDLESKAWVRLI